MMTIEDKVETGSCANQKWEHVQLAWDYHNRKGGCGGGGEGMRDDEVVLGADKRKRARIGHAQEFGG